MYDITKIRRLEKYKYTKETREKMEEYLEKVSKNSTKLPTLEAMCLYAGTLPEIVEGWGEKYTPIMVLLATLRALQLDYLQQNPSSGNIFLLKSLHDMQETKKTEITITQRMDNRPLTIIAGELVKQLEGKPIKETPNN